MTRFCDFCGEGLLDSDRFCQRCGTAQPIRSPVPEAYRRRDEPRIGGPEAKLAGFVPKEEADTLRVRLEELESMVAASIPRREAKAELETATRKLREEIEHLKEKLAAPHPKVKAQAELLGKIAKLEAKLAESVPRVEAERLHVEIEELGDSLRATVAQLQDRLAESVPKAESEAKISELEARLSMERSEIETAGKKVEDLQRQLSRSSVRVGELQDKLSDSVPRTEHETTKGELESKIVDLEAKLAGLIPESEADELRTGVPVASKPAQTFARQAGLPKSCPMCKYTNRFDAMFCASCGHVLDSKNGKDEKGEMSLIAQSPIEQLSTVTAVRSGTSMEDLERLSKLRSLLGSRFKSQENLIPLSSGMQSGDMLEAQLTKLKSLYDSGALTDAEYKEEKRKLLSAA